MILILKKQRLEFAIFFCVRVKRELVEKINADFQEYNILIDAAVEPEGNEVRDHQEYPAIVLDPQEVELVCEPEEEEEVVQEVQRTGRRKAAKGTSTGASKTTRGSAKCAKTPLQ
jgi:hypothetical protein